ncbi:unnamed protein product [Gordionus sp. m RMFG-2023]
MAFDPTSTRLSRILKYVSMLWTEGKAKCSDITVKVGDKSFGAHRIILICHSDYFCEKILGDSNVTEITIPPDFNITPEAFTDVLEFMYKSELALTPAKLDSLMNVAKKLGMYHMTKLCETLAVPAAQTPIQPLIQIPPPQIDEKRIEKPIGLQMPWGGEEYTSEDKAWQPSLRPSAIGHYMKYLWHKRLEDSADFTVNVSGQDFKVHKFILGCHSYFFSELFKKTPNLSWWNVPKFLKVDPAIFQELLKIMYTQDYELNLDNQMISGLKYTADLFKMNHVSKAIDDKYPGIQNINQAIIQPSPLPNYQSMNQPASLLNYQPMNQPAPLPNYQSTNLQYQNVTNMPMNFQYQNPQNIPMVTPYSNNQQIFPQILANPINATGDISEIIRLLSSDSVNMANEMEVFQYALNWLKNQTNPDSLVFKIMSCIRFNLLTKAQLQQVARMTKDWFLKIGEYRDLIITADW